MGSQMMFPISQIRQRIKTLLVLFGKNIKKNSDDRHAHENKTVLDRITDIAIKAWDKVASLFENIDGVEDTVSGRASKIPSSMAIAKYVQQMGGGDMVKSIYDRNGNDIVDDAEALGGQPPEHYQSAEDQKLQTTSKNVVGAINEVFNKTKDVLNTKEEIEANTDPTAIAGALSVKELSNDLDGCKLDVQEDGVYIIYTTPGGADTVRKKLGSTNAELKVQWLDYRRVNGGYDIDVSRQIACYKKLTIKNFWLQFVNMSHGRIGNDKNPNDGTAATGGVAYIGSYNPETGMLHVNAVDTKPDDPYGFEPSVVCVYIDES